jgi:hypothetical protein
VLPCSGVAFRKRLYASIEDLQDGLLARRRSKLLDAIPIAREKMIAA